jgi:hypothetical protein
MSEAMNGLCAAPKDPRPWVPTYFCVYPKGHDGNHSWEDAPEKRRERMKAEGWS